MSAVAAGVLEFLWGYGAAGALFALAFVVRGATALVPGARGSTLGFRLAIVPGAIVLWPYLLVRWLRAARRGAAGGAGGGT